MKNDLIARYIYAVTRRLPQKTRTDVEKELDSLISDMLSERCGDVLPADKDIRVVLTELGTPDELAAKYSGDENKALIGGIYFMLYKRILSIVLPIAAAGIAFATILSVFLEWDPAANPYVTIGMLTGQIIGGVVSGSIQAFAIITIIFAIFEYKKVDFNEKADILSNLPPVPTKNEQIKPHQPIISMMWSVFAAVFFIGFPQFAGAWLDGVGWIPVFNTSVIRGFWLPIVLWAVLGVTKEIVKLIDGQYTKKLAVITFFANIFILISTAIVFLNSNILNPNFVKHVGDLLVGEGGAAVSGLFTNFGVFFFGIVTFALILETAVTAVKAWKHGKAQ